MHSSSGVATRNADHGHWYEALGHDIHGVFNVAGSLSPWATGIAISTSEIPGVDVVTAGASLGLDGLASGGSLWNLWTDFSTKHWGAFGSEQTYLDAGGAFLGIWGFGTSVSSVMRESEKSAAETTVDGLRKDAGKARSGNPAVREVGNTAKAQLPQAKRALNSAGVASAYASGHDKVVNGAGA